MRMLRYQKRGLCACAQVCAVLTILGVVFLNIEFIFRSTKRMTTVTDKDKIDRTEDERRFLHHARIQHIENVCQTPGTLEASKYTGKNITVYFYNEQYNFAYCKVPKCGSTFWTQAFDVLKLGTKDIKDVIHIQRMQLHDMDHYKDYLVNFALVQRRKTPTILVSRDPYTRLYSAFIDKVYLPNIFKVHYAVADLVYSADTKTCPKSATFDEFLILIIKQALNGETLNDHWAPIVSLCRPCDVTPGILLKQETFAPDMQYILEKFKVETDKRDFLNNLLKNNRVQFTIPGIVETVIGRTPEGSLRLRCLGAYGIAYRLWRSFQVQGYLKSSVEFPDITDTSHLRNATFISELIINAIDNNPMSRDESKEQRQQFLEDAYRTVKPETIRGIQQVFSSDFLLYDYDPEPPAYYASDLIQT